TTGAAASEMRCRKSWSRPGRKSWPARCGGRTAGVTPSATRRPKPQISRRTGRAPPGAFGDGIVPRQPTARCPLAHTAVSKRYTSPGVLRSKPNKHRARDAVATADLRFYPTSTQGRFAAGPPRRREVLRSVGPSRPRRPAPPRNLFERTEGKKGRSPAPEKQSHRAAQRWLDRTTREVTGRKSALC